MIGLNFGVGNVAGTPGIISLPIAQRPSAASVADGMIFIDTGSSNIYQSRSGAWVAIGGGGGGTGGIDDVLAIGQVLTTNRIIDTDSYQFEIRDGSGNSYWNSAPGLTRIWNNNTYLDLQINTLKTYFSSGNTGLYFDAITQLLQYGNCDNTNGNIGYLEIDFPKGQFTTIIDHGGGPINYGLYSSYINGIIFVGDKSNNFGLNIDTINSFTKFISGGGGRVPISWDFNADQYDFGETSVIGNFLRINSGGYFTLIGGNGGAGIEISANNYDSYLGNWGPLPGINKNYIYTSPVSSEVRITTQNFVLSDDGSGALLSGTAGGASGDHLVITIDGHQYKIALLNP